MNISRPKPLLLIILDGFGISLEKEGNPLVQAHTPTLNEIESNFPFVALQASGIAVGLPWAEAGNSEVGHLTIGSGRVIYHHLPRIINAIFDGSFFKNDVLLKVSSHVKTHGSRLHIAGLVSSGSVHSYLEHLYALLDFSRREGISEVFIHVFTDGKDAHPQGGAKLLAGFEERLRQEWPKARLASVIGRFYALDRDGKWDRIRKTYELLTEGKGEQIKSIPEYLKASYQKGLTDEFIEPAVIVNDQSARIADNDALIFSDFREDSMRELAHAFSDETFEKFPRKKATGLLLATLTEYEKNLKALAVFPPLDISWPLARIFGEAGMRHLHIAETQKYAHVTYFLNGGKEKPFPGEERILIPSHAAAHFDEVPEMRAPEITGRILENFEKFDVIIANFANADMVGHSGNFGASVRAVEALDASLAQILNAVLSGKGAALITADHGNIELKMEAVSGEKVSRHSLNPVPLYLVGKAFKLKTPRNEGEIIARKKEIAGILTDVAPTALELLGLEKPSEMTGKSLLETLI